jgi:hypothetical protein
MDERLKKAEDKAKVATAKAKTTAAERVAKLKTQEQSARASVKKSFDELKKH